MPVVDDTQVEVVHRKGTSSLEVAQEEEEDDIVVEEEVEAKVVTSKVSDN